MNQTLYTMNTGVRKGALGIQQDPERTFPWRNGCAIFRDGSLAPGL